MEENDAIRRAQMGDQRAFQQIVETYHPLVWRTARALVGDATATDEVVQEAWVDVWRGLARFQLDRPFRPWLLAVVANRSRKYGQRRTIAAEPLNEAALDEQPYDDDGLASLLRLEGRRGLVLALRSLPAEQSRVLALRYFADLDLAEIADVTGAPLGTVKSRIHRALNALRERLSCGSPAEAASDASSLKARAE